MSVFETIRRSVGLSPAKVAAAAASPISSNLSKSDQASSSEKSQVHGFLVLESSKGVEKERYPLQKRITTVGRLHRCDIRLYDETVSRLHCQFCVDDNGKMTLQVFNARGLRLNRQKIQSISGGSDRTNVYPLQESDLIDIFTHRFRFEAVPTDDQGRPLVPQNVKVGRKSLRMSLVQAAIVEPSTSEYVQESKAELMEGKPEEEVQKENVEPVGKGELRMQEQDKESGRSKGRRSFALSTPSRKPTHKGPWESEPRKKRAKRLSLSPIKVAAFGKSSLGTPTDQCSSIVVIEEVDLEVEERVEREVESSTLEPAASTPPRQEIAAERLTKSSSPKKPRRRSSFFGRASIFGGLNLGFYPEERRDNEDEKAVESDIKEAALLSPPPSPTKLQRPVTPEPRLDLYGMPRLPRSMSSPSGLNYGSPGKRRVISLRTATLIKTGQQVFEQQKLLSPPSSPTKTVSSPSIFAALPLTSPEKKAAAGEYPLPESDEEDGADLDDEDEVDKSLSYCMEGDEQPIPPPQFPVSRGPRKSHGIPAAHAVDRKAKSKAKGRVSLPGTLVRVSLVGTDDGGAVDEWRKEWEDQKQARVDEEGDHCGLEEALCDAFERAQDEDTDEEKELEQHYVEEVVDATSPDHKETDQETNDQQIVDVVMEAEHPKLVVGDERDCTAPNDCLDDANSALPAIEPVMQVEQVLTAERQNGKLRSPIKRAPIIPRELLATPAKLSRRASEQPHQKDKRRTSTTQRTPQTKPRRSAGAVLNSRKAGKEVLCEIAKGNNVVKNVTTPNEEILPASEDSLKKMSEVEEESVSKSEDRINEKIDDHIPTRSPRKRTVESIKADSPIVTRQPRAAKVAATAAITGDSTGLREKQVSQSPQKKVATRNKDVRTAPKVIGEVALTESLFSEDLQASQLILESSSPVKRTKRAAKNKAETKIREVLTKKPSMAAMRDARTLSEASFTKTNSVKEEKKANARPNRLPRKASEMNIQSEPSRTTRSRAAIKR